MKKTQIIVAVFGMCLALASMGGPVLADNWSWNTGVETVSSQVASGITDPIETCNAPSEAMSINEVAQPQVVCVTQKTPSIETGSYANGSVSVIHFGQDTIAYPLFNCRPSSCLYDPAQDLVITEAPIVNSSSVSLVIYKHASQRLERASSTNVDDGYIFDFSNPDYVDWDHSGYPITIGAFALSANGRWLAMEYINSGFGVMDLQTLTMTKVSGTAFYYGQGTNPSINLAISNDGSLVVVSGFNATDFLIEVTPGCGFDPLALAMTTPASCTSITLDDSLRGVQNGFSYAAKPYFSDDGSQLTITSSYWPSTIRIVTLRASDAAAQTIEYLGLGDSYTSGEGEVDDSHYLIGTNEPYEKCHTSDRSYPYLVAAMDNIDTVHNVACSGAKMADIESSLDGYSGQSGRLGSGGLQLSTEQITTRQMAALSGFLPGEVPQAYFVDRYHPDVLTVGIGGNDAGFMDKIRACMMPDECEWVTASGKAQSKQEIAALQPKLTTLYLDLHRRSPNSHIYAIGYPQIIQPDGACDTLTSLLLDHAERVFMSESIHYMNQVIAAAAAVANITYINVENAFGEHMLCGGNTQLAVNELQLGDDVAPIAELADIKVFGDETFHPTPLGHQLVATIIHQQLTLPYENTSCTEACSQTPQPPEDWAGDPATQTVATQITTDETALHTPQLTVSLYENELQPGSVARIEIHSTPTQLTSLTANADGSLQGTVLLPTGLSPGYHTLHIYGVSYTGQPVDYYQTLLIQGESTTQSLASGLVLTQAPKILGDTTHNNERSAIQDSAFALVSATGSVKGASIVSHHPSGSSQMINTQHNWWKLIVAALLVTVIMVIIVLLSRSTTPPYDDE